MYRLSSINATRFYKEVSENGIVWCIKDKKGIPAPQTMDGRALPFWSNEEKALKIINNVPAYAGFEPQKIALKDFVDKWLPGMEKDLLLVGLNWGGKNAAGYDVSPQEVMKYLLRTKLESKSPNPS